MKKLILILLAGSLALSAAAQEKFGRWGFQAGATFSTLEFDKGSTLGQKLETKSGLAFGITYDFDLIGSVGINTGLHYVQRNVGQQSVAGNSTFKSASLELPVNLKVTLPLLIVNPYLLAGPYLDCCVDTKDKARQLDFRRFNYGIALGAGIDLLNTLRVVYQYDLGLSSLATSANDALFNTDVKNRSHRISIGILF